MEGYVPDLVYFGLRLELRSNARLAWTAPLPIRWGLFEAPVRMNLRTWSMVPAVAGIAARNLENRPLPPFPAWSGPAKASPAHANRALQLASSLGREAAFSSIHRPGDSPGPRQTFCHSLLPVSLVQTQRSFRTFCTFHITFVLLASVPGLLASLSVLF